MATHEEIQRAKQYPITDIAQYLPKYSRRGAAYTAVCPWHDDHAPSLTIYPNSNRCYCFACGNGGDVITLYMHMYNATFADAVQVLAGVSDTTHDNQQQQNHRQPAAARSTAAQNATQPGSSTPDNQQEQPPTIPPEIVADYAANLHDSMAAGAASFFLSLYDALCGCLDVQDVQGGELYQKYTWVLDAYSCGKYGKFSTFPRLQYDGGSLTVPSVKYMLYDGVHRAKTAGATRTQGAGVNRYYFGAHVAQQCNEDIFIVESEKTAIVCMVLYGGAGCGVYVATGGANNLSIDGVRNLNPAGRRVWLLPDVDMMQEWTNKAQQIAAALGVSVSVVDLRKNYPQAGEKSDITDIILGV